MEEIGTLSLWEPPAVGPGVTWESGYKADSAGVGEARREEFVLSKLWQQENPWPWMLRLLMHLKTPTRDAAAQDQPRSGATCSHVGWLLVLGVATHPRQPLNPQSVASVSWCALGAKHTQSSQDLI